MHASKILLLPAMALLLAVSSVQSRAQNAWGATAACCYPAAGGCGAVSTGYGSGPTQQAASAKATYNALSDTDQSPSWQCNEVRVFNKSGSYVAAGCSEKTQLCGFAFGATKQEAMTTLKSQGYGEDESETEGGCIGQ